MENDFHLPLRSRLGAFARLLCAALVFSAAPVALAEQVPQEPPSYPPALHTDEERACYRTFWREDQDCLADYNYTVSRCANSDDYWFGKQMCYMAAYYFWNSCTNNARYYYSSCLSRVWQSQQQPVMPGDVI